MGPATPKLTGLRCDPWSLALGGRDAAAASRRPSARISIEDPEQGLTSVDPGQGNPTGSPCRAAADPG